MIAQIKMENQEFAPLVNPELGLARGSVFSNLYIPYKYESTKILKGNNPRQNLLSLIDIYAFMVTDLNLYQDTHPNCEKTKKALMTFKMELNKLKDYYNTNFSPLTIDGISEESYCKGPWPWEDRF